MKSGCSHPALPSRGGKGAGVPACVHRHHSRSSHVHARSVQIDHEGGGLEKKAGDLRMPAQLLEALLAEFYHSRCVAPVWRRARARSQGAGGDWVHGRLRGEDNRMWVPCLGRGFSSCDLALGVPFCDSGPGCRIAPDRRRRVCIPMDLTAGDPHPFLC